MTKFRKCIKWVFETDDGYSFKIRRANSNQYLVPGDDNYKFDDNNERSLYLNEITPKNIQKFYWSIEPFDDGKQLIFRNTYFDNEFLMAHFSEVKAYTTPMEHQNVFWTVT